MNKLILVRGIQGSGKSTWARSWVAEDPEHRVRVSLDDLRRMMGPYWIPSREWLVTVVAREAIAKTLVTRDVVFDSMNLDRKGVKGLIKFLRKRSLEQDVNYTLEYVDFKLPLEECLKRNSQRSGDECIKEEVIISTYERFKDFYNESTSTAS